LTYLAGLTGAFTLFKKLRKRLGSVSRGFTVIVILGLCIGTGLLTSLALDSLIRGDAKVYADWEPGDPPNSPMGTARGIFPGRVTWVHDPDATANTPSGSWWQEGNTDQAVVNNMLTTSLSGLTGSAGSAAWDALFRYYNQNHGKGSSGYVNGETIAIKINTVNTNSQNKFGSAIDANAQVLLGLLTQLIDQAGVPQSSIIVYDAGVGTIGSYIVDYVRRTYSGVSFKAANAYGSVQMVQWVTNVVTYSGGNITAASVRSIPRCLYDADYLINLALLKKHESETAITVTAKNHFGSVQSCSALHESINDHLTGMNDYNSLVDLIGHERIGGKTLLFIIDGLWGSAKINGSPQRWNTAPFNGDWPSSIFMSLDGVAIDSVALDFLNAEYTLWANGDNYLHEAAQADNPPSGIFYDPENDGTRLGSLGVHEHWNNPQSKQYSRNLGSGNGIELYVSGQSVPPVGLLGDVNNSGIVEIVDALMTAQHYVGLNPAGFNAANADVNRDGQISIIDALMIAQYYVGLIPGF
jgi:hypothetical protein